LFISVYITDDEVNKLHLHKGVPTLGKHTNKLQLGCYNYNWELRKSRLPLRLVHIYCLVCTDYLHMDLA